MLPSLLLWVYSVLSFHNPSRKLDDVTQEAWDVQVVELDGGNMYFTRFGAGNDKAVIGGNAVWL